jgi:hypothetical protein
LALTVAAIYQTASPSNQYYLTHCGCARPPWGRRLSGIEWIDSKAWFFNLFQKIINLSANRPGALGV